MNKKNSVGKIILVSLAILTMVASMFAFLISALVSYV